ncbi:MAG: helix-turn-helix transcriptional regulator [Halobacteriovoraceae bacterium]|nr:helix-turn-helix transcriptional regulator [Halobacteriovoraceae bacterium]
MNNKDASKKINQVISNFIRNKRLEYHYSQEYLSSLLGISQSKLSKIEAGIITIDILTFFKICHFFRINDRCNF